MSSTAEEKVPRVARADAWRLPDLSRPVLIAVAALLVVMIALPMGWLIVYSLSDKAGNATLGNFVALFTDPTFVDPLITTLIISFSVSAICCAVAAPLGWLVARIRERLAPLLASRSKANAEAAARMS